MARREISAGCVVYRCTDGSIDVALIQPRERDTWSLPKGAIERGETAENAARRETREETGLSGQLKTRIDTIKYTYTAKWEQPPARIFKIVTFFLLQFTDGNLENHDLEVDRAAWFPIDEAIRQASYKQEKDILKKAKRMISSSEKSRESKSQHP